MYLIKELRVLNCAPLAQFIFLRFEILTSSPLCTTKNVEWYFRSSFGLNSSKSYSLKINGRVLFISSSAKFFPMQR